jgi:hypothetical protein
MRCRVVRQVFVETGAGEMTLWVSVPTNSFQSWTKVCLSSDSSFAPALFYIAG